jgi:polysaccharide biosynthesis protein VpsJ
MGSMTASAGKLKKRSDYGISKAQIHESICRLFNWLEKNDYRGYDTFDGLNSKLLRPLTFETKLLRTVLQQGVRRFPINLRPILGIRKSRSTKAMGFLARSCVRLYEATSAPVWRERMEYVLEWLLENQAPGYSGACWANHFDYQSRSSYVPKGLPSVVWTSLIGHAFLDAYETFNRSEFLNVAISSCQHILQDLGKFRDGDGVCIGYFPTQTLRVHNANTLAGGLLARTYRHTRSEPYRELAQRSIQYTAQYQRADSSWYYGEAANLHWVDNFHTAYVLDSFKHYLEGTGDDRFAENMMTGYRYWKKTFFLPDGTPRYYDTKTLPLDIQCCSQAIDTLIFFRDLDPDSPQLAAKVAKWTIEHMQDRSVYFYYRRYSRWLVNKTPTLHWGQATMLCALAGLYQAI